MPPTLLPGLALAFRFSCYFPPGTGTFLGVFGIDPRQLLPPQALSGPWERKYLYPSPQRPSSRWLSQHLGGEEGRMGLFRELS